MPYLLSPGARRTRASRPARALRIATVAVTTAAISAGAATPASATKRSSTADAISATLLTGRVTGVASTYRPHGGDGANVEIDQLVGLGRYPLWHIRTRNLSDPRRSLEDWSSPIFSASVTGPLSRPLAQRIKPDDVYCPDGTATPEQAAYLAGTQEEYAKILLSVARQIEATRTTPALRTTLPAGPVVGGHETVEQWISTKVQGIPSMPFQIADFDAKTGEVRRIREIENFTTDPAGAHPGPAYGDYTRWQLTRVAAKLVNPPAAVLARCK